MLEDDTRLYSAPRVPPELSDRIIDYLHDDVRALSACGLVCREWLPRARFNRFQNTTVDVTACAALLKILARTPDIGALVHSLTIRPPIVRVRDRTTRTHTPKWTDGTLATLFEWLPALQEVHLLAIDIGPATVAVFRTHLARVNKLHLTGVHLQGTASLLALCAALPRLEELTLIDPWVGCTNVPATPADDAPAEGPTELKVLRYRSRTVYDTTAPTLLNWLVARGLHTRLHTLEIPDMRERDMDAVQALLHGTGPALQTLHLSVADPHAAQDGHPDPSLAAVARFSLAPCTGLRTLGLAIGLLAAADTLAWVPHVLATVDSAHLAHVRFYLRAGGADEAGVAALDWAGVARALADPRWGALRRVTFEVHRGTAAIQAALAQRIREHALALDRSRVRVRVLVRD